MATSENCCGESGCKGDDGGGGRSRPQTPGSRRPRYVRLAIMTMVLVLAGVYLWQHWSDLAAVGRVGLWTLLAVVALNAVDYVWNAEMIMAATRPFGVRPRIGEAYLLAIVTRFLNLVTLLRGGGVARALYLNRLHGLAYSNFFAGMAGMLVALPMASVAVALAGLGYLYMLSGEVLPKVTAVLAVSGGVFVVLVLVRPRVREGHGRLRATASRIINGWGVFCRDWRSLGRMLAANLLHVMTMVAISWVILNDMGQPVDTGLLAVIIAVGNLSMIVMVTPGNIGVYEVVLSLVAPVMGIEQTRILAAALTWRVVDMMMVLASGPLCLAAIDRRMRRAGDNRNRES